MRGMKLGELLGTAVNLGVEKKGLHSRLVETLTEIEIRAIGLAVEQVDLKENIILVPEGSKDYPDSSVYLVDIEQTRGVVEKRYRNLLKPFGVEPIIRTRAVKTGERTVDVIDVPLLDAQFALARSDLGKRIPEIYCGKRLDDKHGDFNRCGAEAREAFAQFALGRIPTLKRQLRAERSSGLKGRIQNVTDDVATSVRQKVDNKVRKAFHPHIKAGLLSQDWECAKP